MGLPPSVNLLPCGQCIGCRLERSRQWAIRCVHQAQLSHSSCFITLTYDDQHLVSQSLIHRDFQLFMKRLRKFASKKKNKMNLTSKFALGLGTIEPETRPQAESQITYYMAGEYGSKNRRPHYHACLFNFNFIDKIYYSTTKSKSKIYTSHLLTKLWGKGFTTIGDVNIQSAAYIARYIINKITGKNASQHYQHVNQETGEITDLLPEYNRMSLKNPIGKDWLKRYSSDVYPEGLVHTRSGIAKSPRAYDKWFSKLDEGTHGEMKKRRAEEARQYLHDNTPRRLEAKERVKRAQLNQLLRTI
ncbi:MAG: replication initiator protein [Microvirus sp.]|nr:MAG: replication initiator protein [Microvirus sp.]